MADPGLTVTSTYDLTADKTIDFLNVTPSGTLDLHGFTLVDEDNGVDTTWSGTIKGVVNVGTLNKTGDGTVTFSGLTSINNELHIEGGKAVQTGTTNNIRYLAVGSDGGTASFDISGGTLNIDGAQPPFPAFQVGDFGGTGVVNQSAGAVNLTSAAFNIGSQGGNGTYNLSGGTITMTGSGSGVSIGRNTAPTRISTGVVNITGGLFDLQQGSFVIGNAYAGATTGIGVATQGTVNQSGGTLRIGPLGSLYVGGYNKGTYNLTGGTLEVGGNRLHGALQPSGSTFFNLGGGTIKVIDTALVASLDATLLGGTTSTIDTSNAGATWNGRFLADGVGDGGLTKTGLNTLTLNGVNTYTGLTTVSGGTLALGAAGTIATSSGVNLAGTTSVLDIAADKTIKNLSGVANSSIKLNDRLLTFGTGDNTTFSGGFVGASGDVTKQGSGIFTFGGSTTTVDYFTVNQGTLATSAINALQGTTHVVVKSGATWDLTGAGLQTVNDLQQNSGSTLSVTLGNGHDNIALTAGATITGSTLSVHTGDGNFALTPDYSLMGGSIIAGTFGSVVDDMPLITTTAVYTSNTVKLHFAVSGSIADFGTTPNEKAVGGAINALGNANALYNSLVNQTQAVGEASLQQLAGDFHASTKDVLVQDASYLADAANDRLNALGGAAGGGGADLPAAAGDQHGLWLQGYGHAVALNDSSANAGDVSGSHFGALAGLEGGTGNALGGIGAGYSQGSFNSASRNSAGTTKNIDLLAFIGGDAGAFMLRGGGSYSFNSLATTRTVSNQTLTAAYNARTAQVFGEIGANLGMLEPFAGANYINVSTDAFAESGGNLGVTAAAGSEGVAFTTLGVRFASDPAAGATFRGMAGWRHAFGDTTPLSNLTIQGQSYTVSGVPIASDALVAEAGFDMNVSPSVTLGAAYTGQISANGQDHGGKATATIKF